MCEKIQESEKRADGRHAWADIQCSSQKERIKALNSRHAAIYANVSELTAKVY